MVDRAASSGVVPGEPGGAAVLGASSSFAEGAHHRFGVGGAASAIASQHNHAWIVPPPKQGKLFSAWPYPAGRARCGRVGSVAACRVLLSCGAGRYGWGWAGWAWPEGLGPPGPMGGRLPGRRRRCQARRRRCQRALMSAQRWLDRAGVGLAAARPAQIGGQVAGCRSPPRARAQPSRRSGPGRSPAVTSCLLGWAAVASPRTALAPPQGGRHVDMVVGADHRGRACGGVWRDAASRPLTALRERPDHGWCSCWSRPTPGGVAGSRPAGTADHPALPGPPGSGTQPGWAVPLGHRDKFVAGRPRRSASRSDVWCACGLNPAVAPRTGEVLQGRWPAPAAWAGARGRDVGGYPDDRRTRWRSP